MGSQKHTIATTKRVTAFRLSLEQVQYLKRTGNASEYIRKLIQADMKNSEGVLL